MSEFDPINALEVCAWCDEFALVGAYRAINGGPDPVHICGLCIKKYGHLYEPHHPDCPNLSVPDVMVFCWTCAGTMKWCGCRFRCVKCES